MDYAETLAWIAYDMESKDFRKMAVVHSNMMFLVDQLEQDKFNAAKICNDIAMLDFVDRQAVNRAIHKNVNINFNTWKQRRA
jgi:hypothetical protein